MSITAASSLAVGNAVRVFLAPPATARLWRLLRKETDDISSEIDPAAVKVYEGTERTPLDYRLLANGTTYYYRVFYWDGSAWTGSASKSAVPAATYADASTDVPSLVRDRLDDGLAAEVAAGRLSPDAGYIKVLNAPPQSEDVNLPVVTVHLESEAPFARGLGEMVEAGEFDALSGEWEETEGWLARVQLSIVGWSLNPDERKELRKALRRLIVANLSVFDEVGMAQIEMQQQDVDALSGEYPAPVYQVMCSFSCLAPVRVITSRDPAIADVTQTIVEG